MRKKAAIFSLFCGVAMLVVWTILLARGLFVELETSPFKAMFLLAAEFLTAISLIVSGYGLLLGKSWGLRAGLAALGMLLYCTVFSIGALGSGNPPAAIFFSVIAILAFIFSSQFILESFKGGTQ
jgi:hypothetical protein